MESCCKKCNLNFFFWRKKRYCYHCKKAFCIPCCDKSKKLKVGKNVFHLKLCDECHLIHSNKLYQVNHFYLNIVKTISRVEEDMIKNLRAQEYDKLDSLINEILLIEEELMQNILKLDNMVVEVSEKETRRKYIILINEQLSKIDGLKWSITNWKRTKAIIKDEYVIDINPLGFQCIIDEEKNEGNFLYTKEKKRVK